MKQHNHCFLPFVILALVITISSCNKLVEIAPPKNQLSTAVIFADSSDAVSAVVGIYANIMRGLTSLNFGNGGLTVYTGFTSDEIYPATNLASENEFYNNSISPVNNTLNAVSLWKFAYQLIYQTNACIDGLTASKTLGLNVKNQLLAEAKFARAFFYFYLVNLYGNVPLVTTTDFRTSSTVPRTDLAEVYRQIVYDLTDAVGMLPGGNSSTNRARPNRYTAMALLSRVYLYQGQWQMAENESSNVINSGNYSLETDLNNVFVPTSKEVIWQMIPLQPGFETAEGFKFIPGNSTTIPKCVITGDLFRAFDSVDKRRQQWIRANTVGNLKYYYPYKYHLGSDGNTNPKEYYVVLRFAEQYLIRAEARAHLNNTQGAIDDINAIRKRAGLSGILASDQAAVLAAILQERRLELFCEWGHRWFDLKRAGVIDSVLRAIKPSWQPTDSLFPIPFAELQSNPFLKQNPGY
jgi:starch-binding outer membrane protein, SusD/RagB family